jgi:hypothetical protein
MKISPYTSYLKMQPNALLILTKFYYLQKVGVTPCVDVSHPERTKMHYVTRGYHRMPKRKFNVTYPNELFVEFESFPPKNEQ